MIVGAMYFVIIITVATTRVVTTMRVLWIFYVFLSCVCSAFVSICLYVPCGHLLGKG